MFLGFAAREMEPTWPVSESSLEKRQIMEHQKKKKEILKSNLEQKVKNINEKERWMAHWTQPFIET